MKSFKQYLIEADYSRFLKKNSNLNDNQRHKINLFFSKENPQAGSTIDWQSKKVRKWTNDDFLDYMVKFKSGRKKIIKHQAIKGYKEGTDYVRVIMPSKDYLAYIPLSYEVAQKFNTQELGVCKGDWCIGHSGDPYHWNDEVIDNQQIPIYVVNRHSKWVVMINENNRNYNVWSIENNPRKVREGIPDFSIRKNLLSPKQKAMYDEIRDEYYSEEAEREEIDTADAELDYDRLVTDIENSVGQREHAEDSAREEFHEEANRIKDDTIGKYEDLAKEANDIYDPLEDLFNEGELLVTKLEDEYEEWVDNGKEGFEPTVSYNGRHNLTLSELKDLVDSVEKQKDEAYEEYDKLDDIIRKINDIDTYEMYNSDDIEWTEDPPNEDYIYDDIDYDVPSISDTAYSDYIDLAEEHMGFSIRYSGSSVDEAIREYSFESSKYGTAESLLSDFELFHPDYVNER